MLADTTGIARIDLIGNKLRDEAEEQDVRALCQATGIELASAIPYDESVRQADRRGVALYDYDRDSITVHTLESLVQRLETQFELLPAEAPAPRSKARAGQAVVAEPKSIADMTPEEKHKIYPECN